MSKAVEKKLKVLFSMYEERGEPVDPVVIYYVLTIKGVEDHDKKISFLEEYLYDLVEDYIDSSNNKELHPLNDALEIQRRIEEIVKFDQGIKYLKDPYRLTLK